MTPARAENYLKSLNGNLISQRLQPSLLNLDKVLKKTHCCHKVLAWRVPSSQANPFMQHLNKLDGLRVSDSCEDEEKDSDEAASSWGFCCDCGGFWHSGNVCSHIVAIADEVGALSIDTLLTKLGGRRKVGRPSTHHGHCLDKCETTRAPKFHSAQWYSQQLEKKGALHYHKWRTVRQFGEQAEEYVGVVCNFRECAGPGIKPHGLWKIEDPDEQDERERFEELTKEELCLALALASRRGVTGPSPMDLAPRVI